MSGKLIIQGKAWGEFESAKRSKGNIEISGYRSYGGTHTVRMVEQPQLNENQQIVLKWLAEKWDETQGQLWFPFEVLNSLYYQFDKLWGEMDYDEYCVIVKDKPYIEAYGSLTAVEQLEVLQAFSQWALEQEEE